jgi:hypothetical protein
MSISCPTCHHLHPTGNRCGSPALRGEQFCFFHHPTRHPPTRRAARTPFDVPAITDPEALQIALSEVIRRLADNTLDTKRAGLLLLTLQMAKANLRAMLSDMSRESFIRDSGSSTARSAASSAVPTSPDLPDLSGLLSALGLQPTRSAPGF